MAQSSTTVAELSKQASLLMETGHLHEAIALFDEALTLDPQHVESWINKGLTLGRLNQPEAALDCHNAALNLDATNTVAWLNKGIALSIMGQRDEALSCYDKALEIDSHLASAWYYKGDELGYKNRIIEAKACFENAYNLGLSDARAMIARCEHILMNEWYG